MGSRRVVSQAHAAAAITHNANLDVLSDLGVVVVKVVVVAITKSM